MRITEQSERALTLRFSGFYDFFALADTAPKLKEGKYRKYPKHKELAMKGWEDGASQIKDLKFDVGKLKGSKGKDAFPDFAMAGSSVDVGRYVAGEPECMLRWDERTKEGEGEIFKVGINTSVGNTVRQRVLFNRGAAILTLMEALEEYGMVTEVYINRTMVPQGSGAPDYCTFIIPAKKEGEHLDIARFAYLTSSKQVMESLMFPATNAVRDSIEPSISYDAGTLGDDRTIIEEFDIYLKNASGNHYFRTIESSKEWVENNLKETQEKYEI